MSCSGYIHEDEARKAFFSNEVQKHDYKFVDFRVNQCFDIEKNNVYSNDVKDENVKPDAFTTSENKWDVPIGYNNPIRAEIPLHLVNFAPNIQKKGATSIDTECIVDNTDLALNLKEMESILEIKGMDNTYSLNAIYKPRVAEPCIDKVPSQQTQSTEKLSKTLSCMAEFASNFAQELLTGLRVLTLKPASNENDVYQDIDMHIKIIKFLIPLMDKEQLKKKLALLEGIMNELKTQIVEDRSEPIEYICPPTPRYMLDSTAPSITVETNKTVMERHTKKPTKKPPNKNSLQTRIKGREDRLVGYMMNNHPTTNKFSIFGLSVTKPLKHIWEFKTVLNKILEIPKNSISTILKTSDSSCTMLLEESTISKWKWNAQNVQLHALKKEEILNNVPTLTLLAATAIKSTTRAKVRGERLLDLLKQRNFDTLVKEFLYETTHSPQTGGVASN